MLSNPGVNARCPSKTMPARNCSLCLCSCVLGMPHQHEVSRNESGHDARKHTMRVNEGSATKTASATYQGHRAKAKAVLILKRTVCISDDKCKASDFSTICLRNVQNWSDVLRYTTRAARSTWPTWTKHQVSKAQRAWQPYWWEATSLVRKFWGFVSRNQAGSAHAWVNETSRKFVKYSQHTPLDQLQTLVSDRKHSGDKRTIRSIETIAQRNPKRSAGSACPAGREFGPRLHQPSFWYQITSRGMVCVPSIINMMGLRV